MQPAVEVEGARVFLGDCRDVLKSLPDNSVDSVVTDPPYGLNFMGKEWDNPGKMLGQMATGNEQRGAYAYGGSHSRGYADNNSLGFQLWCTEWAVECLRVLKPGGHILAFGGTRTWHRLAVAIEDAGFELRDSIAWIYGSGFPKSLDVSKAIDKRAGAAREVIGKQPYSSAKMPAGDSHVGTYGAERIVTDITAPQSPEAQKWQGWGTALKPAFEPVVVGRKPIEGTVANNVLLWGVGGLNIDGSRIAGKPRTTHKDGNFTGNSKSDAIFPMPNIETQQPEGRWPANVVLDEFTAGLLDEQSGATKSGKPGVRTSEGYNANAFGKGIGISAGQENGEYGDSGGASRFFYQAKASKRDRNEGLDDLEATSAGDMVDRAEGSAGMDSPRAGAGRTSGAKNFHPTVKPTALMQYLIKLVTPPGGVVLDPFTGSGSTGKAALLDGFEFVGAELTEEYLPIIEGRLRWAVENRDEDGTLF